MRTRLCVCLALGVLIVGLVAAVAPVSAGDTPSTGKIYELRTYKANPGKLEAIHARFRDHACKLFPKHGIELVGAWTPTDGNEAKDTLIYIVAFPSVEAQKKAWAAFRADPEWKKAKADSEKDGVLVKEIKTQNLTVTDFSPLR